jgi:hypothetical protein
MQKSNLRLTAFLALAIAHDIRTQIETKKCAKLFLKAQEAYEEQLRMDQERIKYLCHMLNEHDIPVSEFDLIALNFDVQ